MQKSREGLLRSLLYQLLEQCPDLAPNVCSDRWNRQRCDLPDFEISRWTRRELLQAFDDLAKETALSSKLCFFIDGLDEYNGEHADLIKMIWRLADCPAVKICISSRLCLLFNNTFGRDNIRKMALHEFTKDDIAKYAKNMVGESCLFMQMVREESSAWDLVGEIVHKAQGVFLWVCFAVKSLLRGLEDKNELSTLRRRSDDFPNDLRDFFKRMIDTLDSFYR